MNGKPSQQPLICPGHERPVVQVYYSDQTPDGVFLSSASKDGSPMLRNGTTGDWIGTFMGHKGAVWSCVMTRDSFLTATGSADFTARLWDSSTGEQKHSITHPHMVKTVAFSNSARHLATGSADKKVRMYDLGRSIPPCQELAGAAKPLLNVAFSRDDRLLFGSCSDLPGISVWDARTGELVSTMETPSKSPSIEVCRSEDVVTVASGNQVLFFDANNFTLKTSHTLPSTAECASYCPSRQKFVAGGEDMWVRVFKMETGEMVDCAKGHHGPVHTISFSPGGETFASGSEDGTIRIWETDWVPKDAPSADSGAEGNGNKAG